MSSSMSVNALIGKQDDPPSSSSRQEGQQQTSTQQLLQTPIIPHPQSTPVQSFPESTPNKDPISVTTPSSTIKNIDHTGLLSVLGPEVSHFPYSEQSYIELVKFKIEQERTKQDYYKVEIANKNLSIIETSLKAQIPLNLIPLMCVGNQTVIDIQSLQSQTQQPLQTQGQSSSQIQAQIQAQTQQQPQYIQVHTQPTTLQTTTQQQLGQPIRLQTIPSQAPAQYSASHSRSGSFQDSLNANPIPPMNYRFGGTSSLTPTPVSTASKRPLSPAKIGAQAVANLSQPTIYRNTPSSKKTRSSSSHQRHYSMPSEPSSSKRTIEAIDTQNLSPIKQQPSDQILLHSPSGATSTIQVKPTPAQPLHKQSKSNQPPSQESMTSFQHIIQFHHWKPESPQSSTGVPPTNLPPSTSFKSQSPLPSSSGAPNHKRHKSNADNMSIDLTSSTELKPPVQYTPTTTTSSSSIMNRSYKSESSKHSIALSEDIEEEEDSEEKDRTKQDEGDMSIDSSADISVTKIVPRGNGETDSMANPPKLPGHERQQSNIGRYPHDILSPSNK